MTQPNTNDLDIIKQQYPEHTSLARVNNLTGQQFGSWTVLYRYYLNASGRSAKWVCQCKCGGQKIVSGHDLRLGRVSSCGCLISKGETMVSQVLQEMCADFIQQYSFEDCISPKGKKLKYDFAVFNNGQLLCLIEYDGQQHFMYQDTHSWNTEEHYNQLIIHDEIKNHYCETRGINLIRIPYTINTLDKISKYLKTKMTKDDNLNKE